MSQLRAFIAFVCLLLTLAAVVLWVRGRQRADVLLFHAPAGNLQAIGSYGGGVVVMFSQIPAGREMAWSVQRLSSSREALEPVYDAAFDPNCVQVSLAGFRLAAGTLPLGGRSPVYRVARMPMWAVLLVTAPLPLSAMRRMMRRRRWQRQGRCVACGYDLRETPAGRCPECGNEPGALKETTIARTSRWVAWANDRYVRVMLAVFVALEFALAVTFWRAADAAREGVRFYTDEEIAEGLHKAGEVSLEDVQAWQMARRPPDDFDPATFSGLLVRVYDVRDLAAPWNPSDTENGDVHERTSSLAASLTGYYAEAPDKMPWVFARGGWLILGDWPEEHRDLEAALSGLRRAIREGGVVVEK